VTILGILAVVGALAAVKGAQIGSMIAFGKKAQEAGPPPEAVGSAIAELQAWEGELEAVGSVATSKGVALSTDVSGVVTHIYFESGATAKQGQVLVELDSGVERAQLASAISQRELAATTLRRTKALAATGAVSPAQVDADETAMRGAATAVDAIQAQISKKTITAPFTGKLGIRSVNLGQYLNAGTPVTVLETADALHVDFTLPQQRLADVKVGMPVHIWEESGDAGAPIVGKIAAVDPTVDPNTRNIKLRADTDSTDLRPGMFVRVAVILPQKADVVVVPVTAIVHAPYGDSVFVVEDKDGKKIGRQQFVRVGRARGDFVSITDGLKAKQEIVTAGAFKLRNNSPIKIDNSMKLDPKLDPRPANR
jgi:membrane fusion protein (multidrug efflux system)